MIRVHNLSPRDPVVGFATRELARYLKRMTGRSVAVTPAARYEPRTAGIWVGLGKDLGDAAGRPRELAAGSPDDAILVRAAGHHVLLSGPNGRSVLFAGYRWLEELGCRWLRPGKDGERVPRLSRLPARRLQILEVPSARHRCICIEGSCSVRHVRDLIDHAAKRGFNAYLVQFRNSFAFFERWYGLERNRARRRTPFTSAQAFAAADAVKRHARQRGLTLHTVGHGWTCEPLGIPGEKWAPTRQKVPAAAKKYFALLRGKRELFRGIPLNTHLCYSNPAVQRLLVAAVAGYAATHPREEIVLFALADGANNHCECPRCRPHRPSDLFVRILNQLDAELTRRGLRTRIGFPAYVDLLWAPVREKIANPGRFLLVFAPITRTYRRVLTEPSPGPPERVRPYRHNRLVFSATPEANLKLLAGWKRAFTGEVIIFDYHLWRAHHLDPGQVRLARVLHQDVAHLRPLGFDGFVSCQAQRVAFPTGLYYEVMGRTLWNRREEFDSLVDRHLAELFGRNGPAVRRYLETLSRLASHELLDPADNTRRPDPGALARALAGWSRVPAVAAKFRPLIRRGCRSRDPVTAAAWRILDQHAWYITAYADLYGRIYRGDPGATDGYRTFARELNRRLPAIHHVLDSYTAKLMTQHALAMQHLPFEEHIVVP